MRTGRSRHGAVRPLTAHTAGRALGLFGEPRVNVLGLNLDLDTLASAPVHQAG